MRRRDAEGPVDVGKAVQAACPVQLEVDVEHLAPGAVEAAQPPGPLGDGDAQLDEGKALARLAGAGQQHLVALAQHTVDQGRGQIGQVLPAGCEGFGVGQLVGLALQPVLPGLEAGLPGVHRDKPLDAAAPGRARHPGQAAGVFVLGVGVKAGLAAGVVEVLDPAAVLGGVGRVDVYDGVQALAAALHQSGAGQLQRVDQAGLFLHRDLIRFHQGVAPGGHVLVFHPLAVQGVEADPGAGFGVPVPHHPAEVPAAGLELCQQLAGGAGIAALARQVAAVLLPALGHIADILVGPEQGFQLAHDQLLRLFKVCLLGSLLRGGLVET